GKRFVATEPFKRVGITGNVLKLYRVVISGVPTDISDEEICVAAGAKQAHRIMKKSGEGKVATLAVILTFDNFDCTPLTVNIDYLVFKTRPYVQAPLRCFRCQK